MKTLTTLALLLLAGLAFGDGQPTTAKQAAIDWLNTIDKGQYSRLWNQAAPLFQRQVDSNQLRHMIKSARKPFGDLVARELIGATYHSNLPSVPPGDYVVFSFQSNYANAKSATETVTVALVDQAWRGAGYFIR